MTSVKTLNKAEQKTISGGGPPGGPCPPLPGGPPGAPGGGPLYPGGGPLPPPGGPLFCAMLSFLLLMASFFSIASSSSSPVVFAEISGSLCKTLSEFFNVSKTDLKAFLLSVILAGSPREFCRAALELIAL